MCHIGLQSPKLSTHPIKLSTQPIAITEQSFLSPRNSYSINTRSLHERGTLISFPPFFLNGPKLPAPPQFISALLVSAFVYANPTYEAAAAAGDIDIDRLVAVPEASQRLLEHRVPLTLMRRCLVRLTHEVDLAKALLNDKQAKLQQASTRERNFAIETAGALKRQGNQPDRDDDTPRRPLLCSEDKFGTTREHPSSFPRRESCSRTSTLQKLVPLTVVARNDAGLWLDLIN